MALKLKKNDLVIVKTGREQGKTGKILKVLVDKQRALVEKLMIVKKHTRPTKQNPQGGISEKEASIHLSNLMFFCSRCNKGVRLGAKVIEGSKLKDGKKAQSKVRVCKKCEEVVDKAV